MQLSQTSTPSNGGHQVVTGSAPRPSGEIEDIVYMISHDLRASLRALIEVPQWIEDDLSELGIALPDNLHSSLELLNTNAARLDRMLIDLLVFSRVGRMQAEQSVVLADALRTALDSISIPSGFVIDTTSEWESINYGERDMVTLLAALISNCVKHHDKSDGRILIEAVMEGTTPVLFISNDGPNIVGKFNELIFEFMQTLQPREEIEGSGMGLTIARKIAGHYNGSLTIAERRFERGVTMKVSFSPVE